MNERQMRFRIGLFALAALLLLAVLSIVFSSFPTLFRSHDRYTIRFDKAPGVGPGTPVRRSGVKIGEVASVQLDDATGEVKVAIVVERPHTLKQGEQPVLGHGLLGGDAVIDFVPKPGEKAPPDLPPGSELAGTAATDASALLSQTAELTPQMTDAVREIRRTNQEVLVASQTWARLGERMDVLVQTNEDRFTRTIDNLNDSVTRVGRVLNDENQRNLSAALKNAKAGTDNLESLSRNTDEMIRESRQTIRRVNDSVTRADEVLTNLQQATKPMAERSGTVMKNLDESTSQLNRTLYEARELLRVLNQENGSFRRFASDPALYNNLNDAACMLVRILPRVDIVLRDMEVFADKIARHPESLGLGGVVTPSSGLKESPFRRSH
jgi:phospholipid/cholesterol/gamma-HCH transport system substrate-binding protein